MLALVQGQVANLSPVLDTADFTLAVQPPDEKGKGQVVLTYGSIPVVSGVTYYLMGPKTADLNPITGQYRLKKGKEAIIRAVFSGKHLETTVRSPLFRPSAA